MDLLTSFLLFILKTSLWIISKEPNFHFILPEVVWIFIYLDLNQIQPEYKNEKWSCIYRLLEKIVKTCQQKDLRELHETVMEGWS